jgi:hypothetical protein
MRSFFQNRKLTLVLAILALGALLVLAPGLKELQFNEGKPIGWNMTGVSKVNIDLGEVFNNVSFQSQLVFWVVAILLILLISLLLTPEGRKHLLKILWRAFVSYWMLYYIFKSYGKKLSSVLNLTLNGFAPGLPTGETEPLPPPTFVPPPPSSWITYLITILLILVFALVLWRIWAFWKRIAPSSNEKPLEELARIARSSLRDIAQGGDSTDVIMNCYYRMSNVVSDKRRLHRKDSMTPAEFAIRLEQAGLPGDAVQRLTRLFESVRYGGHRTGPKEINEAVACLTSILNYCGEPV